VDQNNEEAVKAVRFNMGLANDIGSGTTQKRLGSDAIFIKAADEGNVNAQLNLGIMYSF